MNAVILQGGFGENRYPLTYEAPKALLKLGDKTILDHLVSKLEPLSAVRHVLITTDGPSFPDFQWWQMHSSYKKLIHIAHNNVFVPEKKSGVLKDLYLALGARCLRTDDFLVFSGDIYFDFPIGHFLLPCLGHSSQVLGGIYDVKDTSLASNYGVVLTDSRNKIRDFEAKPLSPKSTRVAAGVYYFPAASRLRLYEYLQIDKRSPDRIGDFIAWLAKKDEVWAIELDGTWFHLGDTTDYEEARRKLEYVRL